MRDQARVRNRLPPYLFEYYNVHGYWKTPSSVTKNILGRLRSAFQEALNTRRHLPCFLLVILDKDLIEDIGLYDYSASKEIYECVEYIVQQLDVMINRRKKELTAIKPGALYSSDPKIILVTMLRHPLQFPTGSQMEKVVSLRAKFNNALNDLAYDNDLSILSIDNCNSENYFDLLGNLNHMGQYTYWRQMNSLLQQFDKKKVDLAPIRRRSSSGHCNGSGDRASDSRH